MIASAGDNVFMEMPHSGIRQVGAGRVSNHQIPALVQYCQHIALEMLPRLFGGQKVTRPGVMASGRKRFPDDSTELTCHQDFHGLELHYAILVRDYARDAPPLSCLPPVGCLAEEAASHSASLRRAMYAVRAKASLAGNSSSDLQAPVSGAVVRPDGVLLEVSQAGRSFAPGAGPGSTGTAVPEVEAGCSGGDWNLAAHSGH